MVRKSIIFVTLALAFALPVFAQTPVPAGVRGEIRDAKQNLQERTWDVRQNIRTQVKEARENLRGQIKDIREEFKAKREEIQKQFEVKREEFRQQLEAKREETKSKIEAEREALKARLAKVKDEKKRQAVERIANQIAELNTRRLNHFSEVLNKLERVLERIISRIEKAAARGLDVALPRVEVENAKSAIATAREAIKTQAGKVYTVLASTTTESNLKGVVGNVRGAFHEDLKKAEAAVKAARDAVHKVATTLAQIKYVDEEPPAFSPTSTATTKNP